jgi:hypothetical protein
LDYSAYRLQLLHSTIHLTISRIPHFMIHFHADTLPIISSRPIHASDAPAILATVSGWPAFAMITNTVNTNRPYLQRTPASEQPLRQVLSYSYPKFLRMASKLLGFSKCISVVEAKAIESRNVASFLDGSALGEHPKPASREHLKTGQS